MTLLPTIDTNNVYISINFRKVEINAPVTEILTSPVIFFSRIIIRVYNGYVRADAISAENL